MAGAEMASMANFSRQASLRTRIIYPTGRGSRHLVAAHKWFNLACAATPAALHRRERRARCRRGGCQALRAAREWLRTH
jgi:hypothetical protein